MFFRQKKYQMNIEQADATLQKVFATCKQSPNTTSFDKLLLRRQLNTRFLDNLLILTAIILLLTFLAPLFIASVNAVFPEEVIYRETVTDINIPPEDTPIVYSVSAPQEKV